MTTTTPPQRDTLTKPPERREPSRLEPRVPRRPSFTRWLAWLTAFVVVAFVIAGAVFLMRDDDTTRRWTADELQEIADSYAGDLDFVPARVPVYSPELQAMLDEIAASYAGDLDPQPLEPGDTWFWLEVGQSYGTDLDTGLDVDAEPLLEELAEFARMYEGELVDTR